MMTTNMTTTYKMSDFLSTYPRLLSASLAPPVLLLPAMVGMSSPNSVVADLGMAARLEMVLGMAADLGMVADLGTAGDLGWAFGTALGTAADLGMAADLGARRSGRRSALGMALGTALRMVAILDCSPDVGELAPICKVGVCPRSLPPRCLVRPQRYVIC
jgi:hypothetical protein